MYEKYKLYRFNPCDVGAFPVVKFIGRVLSSFATQCPCCNGARILFALSLGILEPEGAKVMLGFTLSVAIAYALVKDEDA
jgi:hypothetical protein